MGGWGGGGGPDVCTMQLSQQLYYIMFLHIHYKLKHIVASFYSCSSGHQSAIANDNTHSFKRSC